MRDETAIELALHDVETREEVLDVARAICAAASWAHAAGYRQLRHQLVARAATVLGYSSS